MLFHEFLGSLAYNVLSILLVFSVNALCAIAIKCLAIVPTSCPSHTYHHHHYHPCNSQSEFIIVLLLTLDPSLGWDIIVCCYYYRNDNIIKICKCININVICFAARTTVTAAVIEN